MVSRKLQPFGTTIFSEMTKLAEEVGATNLSQGFPDFDGPEELLAAAADALRSGENQYARSMGHPLLVDALAKKIRRDYGLEYDPQTEVAVFSGATEGIASALLGLLDPGDEVLLIEPYYDSYPACVAMASAVPKYTTLRFPDFRVDFDDLEKQVSRKTRLVVLNTPHNPTGKVYTRDELVELAELAIRHDLIVLADEVYEHLTYDGAQHVPIASLPGMRERTLTISSVGKTYSVTGWKIGWATGPRDLVAAAQAAHQFLTFATATPLQVAVAKVLAKDQTSYLERLRREYSERRRLLLDVLDEVGFRVSVPRGTYFVLADFSPLSRGDDVDFVRRLARDHRVAAIPPTAFYSRNPDAGRHLVRFAFCKKLATLEEAAERLRGLLR